MPLLTQGQSLDPGRVVSCQVEALFLGTPRHKSEYQKTQTQRAIPVRARVLLSAEERQMEKATSDTLNPRTPEEQRSGWGGLRLGRGRLTCTAMRQTTNLKHLLFFNPLYQTQFPRASSSPFNHNFCIAHPHWETSCCHLRRGRQASQTEVHRGFLLSATHLQLLLQVWGIEGDLGESKGSGWSRVWRR